jgi:HTH-type transcriptional repressor of NAD biosynthesis genes
MKTHFSKGLIVGKFCPLHLGHEYAIRQMIAVCEDAFIVSYTNPEFPGCEPAKRQRWLKTQFPTATILVLEEGDHGLQLPHNDADERTHRRFVGRLCREILGTTVDAVFTSEDYGPGFAQELTAFFREREPSHPEVQHISVDPLRLAYPISGMQLRGDIHRHRSLVSPIVYGDFVQRICLLGGESSGKSTLAAALAQHFKTQHVPEYGRELWEQQDGHLDCDDMLHIAQTQVAREDTAAPQSAQFLFCDTSPLTTLFYSHEMFGRAEPELEHLASRSYQLHVLCAPDFPFIQDGTRRDESFRDRQHSWYMEELVIRKVSWIMVHGSIAERIGQVSQMLAVGGRGLEMPPYVL